MVWRARLCLNPPYVCVLAYVGRAALVATRYIGRDVVQGRRVTERVCSEMGRSGVLCCQHIFDSMGVISRVIVLHIPSWCEEKSLFI